MRRGFVERRGQVDRELASGEYFMKENERRQRKRQMKLVRLYVMCPSVCLSVRSDSVCCKTVHRVGMLPFNS